LVPAILCFSINSAAYANQVRGSLIERNKIIRRSVREMISSPSFSRIRRASHADILAIAKLDHCPR
jgi:hypothetical protein